MTIYTGSILGLEPPPDDDTEDLLDWYHDNVDRLEEHDRIERE